MRRVLPTAMCAALLALGAATPARALEPLYVHIPSPPPPPATPTPPPTGYLYGPCGLAVNSSSQIYVSDYYHHTIDIFSAGSSQASLPKSEGSIPNVDPADGPCGLAFDSSNGLYVNDFHRNVMKAPPSGTIFAGAGADSEHPTGVAVDAVNRVYVDDRTYIAVYDSSGNPVLDGGNPLKIGDGSIGEGYGVAVSQYPATLGHVYVPDASTDTVKVFDPTISKTTPIQEIKDPFNKPFSSLRDSAIAVDKATGEIYFADNTQPDHAGRPQATIYVYGWGGSSYAWKGFLPYQITDALPPGIAVDNTANATAGRVYVTSGNTTNPAGQSGWYAYPPNARVTGTPKPSKFSLSLSATSGTGSGAITSDIAGVGCSSACEKNVRAGATVDLSAAPAPGSTFAGWSGGGCSGIGDCTVQMTEARSVGASFEATAGPPAPAANGQGSPFFTASAGQAKKKAARDRRRRDRKRQRHRRRHRARQATQASSRTTKRELREYLRQRQAQ